MRHVTRPAPQTTHGSDASAAAGKNSLTRSQRRLGLIIVESLSGIELNATENAESFLSAAHGCAARGEAKGAAAFRACIERAPAGSEAIDDGPPLHDPLSTWRTAEADLGNLVPALADSPLVSSACRKALRTNTDLNWDDALIWRTVAAGNDGKWREVLALATPKRAAQIQAAGDRYTKLVAHTCAG